MTGGTTVADLLEAAAARQPAAVAVEAGGASLTYGELAVRANGLAARLQSLGVGPDVRVGVYLNRSVELAVALVAVLEAGGACVPLDPANPAERLAFMADDAAVAAVLTRSDLVDGLPAGRAPVVLVDLHAAGAPAPPPRTAGADHVAYVIYTSGSTGRPKGVLLTNRGLANHHRAVIDLYALAPGDRVLQFCSIGFDASIEEMLASWAAGATVVFRPEDMPLLGVDWVAWLRDRRITVMNLPTAYWHAWTRDLDAGGWQVPESLRLVVVGGERATGAALRVWNRVSGGRSRWVNAYGPTETTCMSTFYEAGGGAEEGDPPIGRPLPGTTVAVVDDALRVVGAGVVGELLIGGEGLARGYLNAPERTAERFVEWRPGERMYRTGDLVRERPDGALEYVGRADEQVKVQGYRVECSEVEAALLAHPSVAEAAVVARDEPPGDRRLVAYVAGAAPAPGPELRSFLAARLPAHMVPAAFVPLDVLPLTPNGKVDRAALPAPAAPVAPVAVRSPEEDRMAAIWAEVLRIDAAGIGADTDFFELGGHSLLATQLIAKVREAFGTETSLRAVFQAPTLGALTSLVRAESRDAAPAPPLVARRREPGDRFPLSLAQEQMWGLEVKAVPQGLYNVTALHRFEGPVDVDALRHALAFLVDRHEILRAAVMADGGRPTHVLALAAPVALTVGEGTVAEQDAAPFDLERPPLVRAGLYPLDDGATRLAVTFDHLVADGTGAEIFVTELLAAYRDLPPALPALAVQFADFAIWQRAHVTEDVLRRQLDWWSGILHDMPLGPAVAFDHVPETPTKRFGSRPIEVSPAARARLEEVARATASSVFTVAVAAVSVVFGRHGGSEDVVFSTTLSGRTRVELENLVGMFSGIGRLRTDLSGDPPFAEVVTRTRDRVLGMFENQDIPFMRVRRALLPDFPAGGPALFAALPTDLQYFHTRGHHEVFFRGQLHPLGVTLFDDGERITGAWSFKRDYYDDATVDRLARDLSAVLDAAGADPALRVSELPVSPST